MRKNQYKVEILRTNGNIIFSAKALEKALNRFAVEGWRVLNTVYHPSLLCYEILLERSIDEDA